ncbi:GNAT family N-acetyltransferase [Streptomyces sp. 6N223]|uniref:GNAT family N-acetyltransferase n=1 Tax=Streptomyces sp. 6N223 TaxID=3457412 RepID=UPI003FD0AFDF
MTAARLRPARGTEGEYAAIAEVHRRGAEHDGLDPRSALEPVPSAADVAERAGALADPGLDQRVVEAGGRLVGHVYVVWWPEEDGTRVFLHRGCLLPEFRGRGIGTAMLGWAERRARAMAASLPPGRDVLGGNAARRETAATSLLLDHGYAPALRLGEYRYRLPGGAPVAEPHGTGVRAATTDEEYAALWELIEVSYRGRPGIPLGTEAHRRRFVERARSMTWLAAWDGAAPVGCTGLAVDEDAAPRARIMELSVHPAHRRRGIGRALLLHGLSVARARNAAEVRLWTNLEGPQRAFELYEDAGFRQVAEFVRYRRALEPGPHRHAAA